MAEDPDRNRNLVKSLAAIGFTAADISRLISLPQDEIEAKYSAELTTGPLEAEAKAMKTLYDRAMSGDIRAMDLWIRTRPGYF